LHFSPQLSLSVERPPKLRPDLGITIIISATIITVTTCRQEPHRQQAGAMPTPRFLQRPE